MFNVESGWARDLRAGMGGEDLHCLVCVCTLRVLECTRKKRVFWLLNRLHYVTVLSILR